MKLLNTLTTALLFIGGLNWGLVGLMNMNLVSMAFGEASMATTITYSLVGISAAYQFISQFMLKQETASAECAA